VFKSPLPQASPLVVKFRLRRQRVREVIFGKIPPVQVSTLEHTKL